MIYGKCRLCADFWVTRDDEICPNCGAYAPIEGTADRLLLKRKKQRITRTLRAVNSQARIPLFVVAGLCLVIVIADRIRGGVMPGPIATLAAAIFISTAIGIAALVAYIFMVYSSKPSPDRQRLPATHLQATAQVVERRLCELNVRQDEITRARGRVADEDGGERWNKARAVLDKAMATLIRQRERYITQQWEIALIRWQNQLEPLASDFGSLTHDEIDRRLSTYDNLQVKGNQMLQAAATALPTELACVNRIREALSSAEQLRQELVAQETVIAVRGVSGLDDVMDEHHAPTERLDFFNARVKAINDVASSFDTLEAEHQRLLAEESLMNDLKQR